MTKFSGNNSTTTAGQPTDSMEKLTQALQNAAKDLGHKAAA